ncbi:type I restriction-modification system specificity subunit S [Flammeovirgaceae bacterium 311]|nr:type I restriction-modification system specificity subunit S [Flammeovirgaceae bacterium 311]
MEAIVEEALIVKYPAYKDSGVEWLGDVPSHWKIVSLGSLLELKSDKNHPDYEVLSVYREYGVIPKDSRDDNHNATSLDTTNYKAVEPGDLVVNKMKAWQGSMGISGHKGIVSPAYITCKVTSREVYSKYLHQLLRSNSYIGEYNRISYGVRVGQWDMHYEDFKKVITLLPPKEEQTAIAQFLDRKTAQIDKAIAIKVKQIELLKERRQILIHNAVIRGLNPEVPMKDSGVEWIGEIPMHWKLTQIKKIALTTSGGTPPSGNVDRYYNGHIPWVRTTDLNNDELFDVPEKITDNAIRDTACKLVPENTVCVAMYGGPGTIGKHAILRIKATLNQALCGIVGSEKLHSEFLYYYIKFCRPYWMIGAKGTRIDPNINQDEVRNMAITLPPKSEQIAISEYISDASGKIIKAITLKEKETEKLQEYKASLINSAVTGKIKVC